MSPLSVLLLTLPIPEPPAGIQKGNHQLFAHFFENFLRLRGEERFAVHTLPRRVTDCGTNEAVVEAILALEPDVVGFSLYLWNVERSIDCAGRLKASRPGLAAVGGGPEVQPDNGYLLSAGAFDFLVRGEGEAAFLELLGYLEGGLPAGGDERLLDLPSLFVRSDLVRRRGPDPAPRYLEGGAARPPVAVESVQEGVTGVYREGSEDDFAYLEIVRGCPFSCSFCSYAKNRRSVSRLPLPSALESIRALMERNVGEIYLLAPTVNSDRRYFRGLVDGIGRIRKELAGCRTVFFSELKGELLADDDVGAMVEAGFVEFELGIQTLRGDIAARAGVPAPGDDALDRIARILAAGGRPIVDFIVGLPGERYEDCIRTIETLDGKGLLRHCVFYHLLVLPGSALRGAAAEKGYEFSAAPPYQVLKTDAMDIEDIKTVYLYLEHRKNHSYYSEPVYSDPAAVFALRRPEDGGALEASRSVKTGSLIRLSDDIGPRGPGRSEWVVETLAGYVRGAPEVFHHAFILANLPGSVGAPAEGPQGAVRLLAAYRGIARSFRDAPNYYDRYCLSLDYLGGETFSKKVTILVDPFGPDADALVNALEVQDVDYAFAASLEALGGMGEGALGEAIDTLRAAWSEKGVYTVLLDDTAPPEAGPSHAADGSEAGARGLVTKLIRGGGDTGPDGEEGFAFFWMKIAPAGGGQRGHSAADPDPPRRAVR